MPKLILSDEEKAMVWNELDDHALAMMARHCLLLHDELDKGEGLQGMITTAAACSLVRAALAVNSTDTSINLENVTIEGKPEGNWDIAITIKRSEPEQEKKNAG